MATTSPDGIVSPNSTDPVDFIADWAATASSVQTALSNRASKTGTTTQRNAATGVQDGTLWFDTTDRAVYRFSGGTWAQVSPENIGVTSPTGIFTPASGVSVVSFVAQRVGAIASISVEVSGTFSGTANVPVGTLSAPYTPRTTSIGPAYYAASGFLTGVVRINGSTGGTSAVNAWKENGASRSTLIFSATFAAV